MSPEIIADGFAFTEGPRWHQGEFYFSDQHGGVVWKIASGGKLERLADVPKRPSGLDWTLDGELLIISMLDRRLLKLTPRGLEVFVDLTAQAPGPLNDMVTDAQGRTYVGNFGYDLDGGEPMRSTNLLLVEPDGKVSIATEDVVFPNGSIITPDGKTFILAETFAFRLSFYLIEPSGKLTNRRIVELGAAKPDGICLDAEGAVWVADPGDHRVLRVDQTGKVLREIPLPGRHAYACMLGGADRRDLYICTCTGHNPEKTVVERTGKIEMIRVDVPGVGRP